MPRSTLGPSDGIVSPHALAPGATIGVRKPRSGGASGRAWFGPAVLVNNPFDERPTGAPMAERQGSSLGDTLLIPLRAGQALVAHEGLELSGYTAFTALLSLFPFLLFLTALAGFLGDESIAQ